MSKDVFVLPSPLAMARALGVSMREHRARLNVTQSEVADELSVDPSQVSRWESGTMLPHVRHVLAMARFFGVTCDEMLGSEVYPIPISDQLDAAMRGMRKSGIDERTAKAAIGGILIEWMDENGIAHR